MGGVEVERSAIVRRAAKSSSVIWSSQPPMILSFRLSLLMPWAGSNSSGCSKARSHGYHLHETYEVDGEAYHGTVHLLPVGLPGTEEETYEAVVESGLLPLVEAQGNGTPALELIDRGLPLVAHPVEFLLASTSSTENWSIHSRICDL